MKKINNNPFNLQVALSEEITVDVQSQNTTAHLVNAVLDGQGHILHNGEQLKFLVTKPKHKLTMVYTFATQSGNGGRYDTTITGSSVGAALRAGRESSPGFRMRPISPGSWRA